MKSITLTKTQARKIILHAAGLAKPAQFGKGKEAVYKMIDHLGFVQLDTNYVVERAHHHMFAARIPGYKLAWVDELQADGRIVEAWTYASGYIPTHDFRFSLPVKESFVARREHATPAELTLMRQILDRIAREGPVMARDFENDRVTKSTGWWDWRPSKVALERLYLDGRLLALRQKNFQKVFDLTDNIIPSDTDKTMPTPDEYARHVILRSLKTLGIAAAKDIAYPARYVKSTIKTVLQQMADNGEICTVEVKDLKSATLYMLPAYMKKTVTLSGDVFILSPFDILNIHRHRLRDFFDFDYQVECFVPAAKRKYGYFSLPIIAGDTFIARMDAKADRKNKVLVINNLHFEDLKISKPLIDKLCDAIIHFGKFNQCQTIDITKSNNTTLSKTIQKKISA